MCLDLKKNICLFKIIKSKELSKKYKKKLSVYKKKKFKTKPLHPDDCWRLLATASGSWAACDSWRLLATPGVVCILVVPVVPNKKIRYILFQVSHSKTYKIYCKELVQATCKITSKIKM